MTLVEINPHIPVGLNHKIEGFTKRIISLSGSKIVSIYLHGDFVRQTFYLHTSKLNILLVFEDTPLSLLQAISPTILQATEDFKLDALIITLDTLHSSADVFPMELLSVRQNNKLLYGKDTLEDLVISLEDLRLSCEMNLKKLMLDLRHFFVLNSISPEKLVENLGKSTAKFIKNLDAALYLRTNEHLGICKEIIQAAAKEFDLNYEALEKCYEIYKNKYFPTTSAEIFKLYDHLAQSVKKVAEIIDKYKIYN